MTSGKKNLKKLGWSDWPKHVVIFGMLLIELFPLYMMFQISVKDNVGFIQNPWLPPILSDWKIENWIFGFTLILPYVVNTVFVAVSSTLATLVFAVAAAYVFGRYKIPFSGLLWAFFLILMLMPSITNIAPLFALLNSMHLVNTLWALVFVGIAASQAFNIIVLKHFVEELPRDLFEAADIDGAGHIRKIWNIVVPLSGNIIGTLGILTFLNRWNEFLLPLIILREDELFTIGVGLIYLDGEYVKMWGQTMAAFLMAALPLVILFLFTMRLFVRGLSSGAVKG